MADEDRRRPPRSALRNPDEPGRGAGAPGASGPGEPGYEGEVTIGDESASPSLDEQEREERAQRTAEIDRQLAAREAGEEPDPEPERKSGRR